MKFLFLATLAVAFCATPAAAQRVGPVEDEPIPATGGAAAREEKKRDAAKAEAKTNDKEAVAGKPAVTPATVKAAADDKAATAAAAKQTSPAATDIKPAPQQSNATAGGEPANAAARGEKTAAPAGGNSSVPQADQAKLPVSGSPSIGVLPSPPKYEAPAPVKAEVSAATNPAAAPSGVTTVSLPPTSIYRVGVGDILDIRLTGGMSREATLFTVLTNGVIDYPLAGEPTQAAGLTAEELGARLSAAIKRRGIYDRAQFQITVREYVSHTALVSGLVDQPGQKVLRREAVPLYVLLAEAFPRPDAGRVVVISRATGQTRTLDLSDSDALNELVSAGDVINVQPRPREFFYIGGQINSAGQKDFNPGLTLTQAILASGGLTREAGAKVRVAVARQGADGRLVTTEYNLQEIEAGRIPDPRVQPGDRIEIGRRR